MLGRQVTRTPEILELLKLVFVFEVVQDGDPTSRNFGLGCPCPLSTTGQ